MEPALAATSRHVAGTVSAHRSCFTVRVDRPDGFVGTLSGLPFCVGGGRAQGDGPYSRGVPLNLGVLPGGRTWAGGNESTSPGESEAQVESAPPVLDEVA